MNRVLPTHVMFALALVLILGLPLPSKAQSYSTIVEGRELQEKARVRCEASQRYTLAEYEAREDGRPEHAEIFRKEKEKFAAECQELLSKVDAINKSLAEQRNRSDKAKDDR